MGQHKKTIGALLLVLIIIVFSVLNINDSIVNFGFWQMKLPLIIVIIFSVIFGSGITILLSGSFTKSK